MAGSILPMSLKPSPAARQDGDLTIARLLSSHYGDGTIYLPRERAARATVNRAVRAGFLTDDGFITRKGRRLLAHTEFSNLRG